MICVCMYVRTYVSVTLRNVAVTSRWNVAVSTCHAGGLRNSECHVCGVRRERRRVELKVWRRTERGLQVEEEESVVFLNIEVSVKRAGPSGLGDLGVTEYIARIRSRPFEREDGAPVHLATTEARFMPD